MHVEVARAGPGGVSGFYGGSDLRVQPVGVFLATRPCEIKPVAPLGPVVPVLDTPVVIVNEDGVVGEIKQGGVIGHGLLGSATSDYCCVRLRHSVSFRMGREPRRRITPSPSYRQYASQPDKSC